MREPKKGATGGKESFPPEQILFFSGRKENRVMGN